MSTSDVVVTGLGATTPLGGDVPSTWDALLAGRVSLFLGAGVSINAGLPSWQQLTDLLAGQIGLPAHERLTLAQLNPLEAASVLAQRYGGHRALKEACADVIATWQAAQEPCVPKTPTAVTATTHRAMGQEWDASQARSIEHAEEDVHTYERDAGGIAQARRQEGHVRGLWLAARHRLPLRGLWRAAHHRLPRCSEVCLTACGTRAAHWVRVRVTLGLPLKAPVGVEVRAEQGGPCR